MSQAQLLDTCMTAAEARACIEQMKTYAHRFRALALELYERGGWRALGYASWRACAVQEFGLSQPRVYQLLVAAQVERNISTIVETGTLPESHLRPLTRLAPELQPDVYQYAVETAPNGKVTAAHVDQVVRAFEEEDQPVGKPTTLDLLHSSKSVEWYTPAPYIESARAVMGGIDLDPASCSLANQTVRATTYYSPEHGEDGYSLPLFGRIWVNPPYGKEAGDSNQGRWSARVLAEYRAGSIEAAVLLVGAKTSEKWFRPLWDYPMCFPDHRIDFYGPPDQQSSGVNHGSVLVYFGTDRVAFRHHFRQYGRIVLPEGEVSVVSA